MLLGTNLAQSGAAMASMAGSFVNAAAQRDANDKNVMMAREQMAFQERMSNSAYQRTTEDMRKAGINPMLAYQQGGASTPTGASASIEAANFGDTLKEGVSSALATTALKKDLEQKDADIALAAAGAEAKKAEAKMISNSAKTAELTNKKLEIELPGVKAEQPARIKHGKINEKAAIWDAASRRLKDLFGIGASAAEIGSKLSK